MGKLRNTIIIIFMLILIGLAVIIYAVPSVTGMLVETYPAEYGELEIYDDTVGYFFRNEVVYGAADGGDVNRLAQEGELLRPFTTVVEISGTSPDPINPESDSVDKATEIKKRLEGYTKIASNYQIASGGVVSFFIDGYEKEFTIDRAENIQKDQLTEISQSDVMETGKKVRPEYPLFKIISNNGWQLVAYVPMEHLDQYSEGQSVDVTFFNREDNDDKDFVDLSEKDPLYNKVEMLVKSVKTEGDYGRLILKSSRFFGGIGQYRVANCRIVSHDVSGLLIENGSITEVDGKTGVYVKNKKGKYDFVPVMIYGSSDHTTVIADKYFYNEDGEYVRTVDPFDDVLRKPREEEEE